MNKAKKKAYQRLLKPMSLNDFHEMIIRSQKDVDEGRTTSQEDLVKKIKSW